MPNCESVELGICEPKHVETSKNVLGGRYTHIPNKKMTTTWLGATFMILVETTTRCFFGSGFVPESTRSSNHLMPALRFDGFLSFIPGLLNKTNSKAKAQAVNPETVLKLRNPS